MTTSQHERVQFMGCPIDTHSSDESLSQIVDWCRDDKPARIVTTVNAAILMMMRKDEELKEACTRGDMILADGMPIVFSSRMLKLSPDVHRVAGVDLMHNLLRIGHEEKLSIFLLGAKQEVIDTLTQKCGKEYPNLTIAGSRNGYFSEAEHPEVIKEVRDSKADILFIGMPTPFKEVWAEKYRDELGVSVILGVGGSFDVIAGYIKRAPVWMQNMGLEWFWRLQMEPRKMWKRYLTTNSQFIANLFREMWHKRTHPQH